jgi:hypothetical protein
MTDMSAHRDPRQAKIGQSLHGNSLKALGVVDFRHWHLTGVRPNGSFAPILLQKSAAAD